MAKRQSLPSPEPTRVIAEGKYIRLARQGRWEYAERNNCSGAVVIVAVTDAGKLLLIEQHRVSVDAPVIELPAGLVGDIPGQEDEAWAEAAKRELEEETGYLAKRMKHLTSGPISAGFSNETISLFLASGLSKVHKGGGVDGEDIRIFEVSLKQVPAWLRKKQRAGALVDPKVFAGLFFAHQYATS